MKLLDLFSGIGGFSLGAEYNNIKTVGFVEKDAYCQKVLRKHWPNTPIIGDIRDVKKDTFESVDIVSGGFPCQPFSVAGKRRGTDDDRYLWDETIRVVSLYKPRWFVGENVEGIVNIQNGLVLRQVQDDLEKEGFEVQCGIIPASGIGAWHQRKRVWIIAHSNSNRESRCSQYVQERPRELGESHVSNTIGELSDGCSGTTRHSESELKGMVSNEAKNRDKVRSETERCSEQATTRGNVSDTHDSRLTNRPQQHQGESTQEREGQPSSSRQSSVSNVSNTNSNLRRGRRAILQNRENKIWGFYNEKSEQTSYDLRGETIRCDVISGEKEDVSNPQNRSRQQTQWQGRESIGRGSDDRRRLEGERENIETDVSKSWWEIESSVCTVPNGVSYKLDKDRVNQIKSLGNSIVPQIAYQIFKAIVTVDKEE